MSMETHVFFRGKLPTKSALSRAMKELGFPFSITPSTGLARAAERLHADEAARGGDRRRVRRL